MKRISTFILGIFCLVKILFRLALAENKALVPCSQSTAFVELMKNAPDGYYTTKPFRAYSQLLCGDDGLPHLVLDRLSFAIDVLIPIGIFLYIAGFIGWTGRCYLGFIRKSDAPELKELFIDIPLFIASLSIALLWPLAAFKDFVSGDLVAKDEEIPISVR
ncbi:MAG: Photosystem I reaction center subunit III [Microcoleus sp. SM1_3_4]|nr:Photosystem I reaction center subunit III [Microcoleus sp. SM1_3_4]